MLKRLSNCGGFIFVETLLIVMLLSTAALLVMRGLTGAQKVNRDMAIKTAAIHLANGTLAECENSISQDLPLPDESIETFENVLGSPDGEDKGMTVEFLIDPSKSQGNDIVVTVTPTVNGIERSDLAVTAEKYIIKKRSDASAENGD